MRDLIFFSLENWDQIWRRNQFLCARWASRFPLNKVLFLGHWEWAKHLQDGQGQHNVAPLPELPNLHIAHIPKIAPNKLPGGKAANAGYASKEIRRMAKAFGLNDPLLWLNPYDYSYFIGRLGERGVIYDITDDWELAETDPQARAAIERADRELCRRADLTIVCSQALYDSRLSVAKRLRLLPNGVDFEHYRASYQPPTVKKYPSPVLGYTGSLHAHRIDLNVLGAIAKAFKTGTILLVGPDCWEGDELRDFLKAHPNVVAPGPVNYQDVPTAMADFEVCIVPHHQNQFTESLNPLKLWEYLACGKPIVSTCVAGFRDYAHLCRLAPSPAEFVAQCQTAINEELGTEQGKRLAEARRAEAARHSWDSRFDDLTTELKQAGLV